MSYLTTNIAAVRQIKIGGIREIKSNHVVVGHARVITITLAEGEFEVQCYATKREDLGLLEEHGSEHDERH